MGSSVNGFQDNPRRMVERREKKGRYKDRGGKERIVRYPRVSSDTMYKWSMWRMYLNEDMSHALSHAHTHGKMTAHLSGKEVGKHTAKQDKHSQSMEKAVTVSSIGAIYIGHRDAMRYGHLMKTLSKESHRAEEMERILPDNEYLVYGLPRISLARELPKGVRELYTCTEKDTQASSVTQEKEENIDTDKCINKLFDFVADEMKEEPPETIDTKYSVTSEQVPKIIMVSPSGRELDGDVSVKTPEPPKDETDGKDMQTPLVSKSRLFWEKLANSKSKIIKAEKVETKENVAQNGGAISSDVLLRQQKMLKKTNPQPRSSRDLWRTLAQRKHEILELRSLDDDNEAHKRKAKKPESKTSQLWSFIFSKKKEMVQMKRNKMENTQDKGVSEKKLKSTGANVKNEKPAPTNFQDNFQKELEARLKKFRQRADQEEPVTEL